MRVKVVLLFQEHMAKKQRRKLGRPPRTDDPIRITVVLGNGAYKKLMSLSRRALSRSAVIEGLLNSAPEPELAAGN
jgi:hypothetical protein